MKELNNPVMEDMIKKGQGHALFIGFVYSKPKIIFASCSIQKGIKYYDFRTTKELDPISITRIVQFTQSSSKQTEDAITVDLFYKHTDDLAKENTNYNTLKLNKKGEY